MRRVKILIASTVDPAALAALEERHDVVCAFNAGEDELVAAASQRNAIVFRSGVHISERVMQAAPDLELVIRAGSGFDNIDLNHLATRRVRFVRIPGPGAVAVAELAFALMLGVARRLRWADRELRKGHWVKSEASGALLAGKTLGIVGAGSIGARTGALGAAWGMRVLGCVEPVLDGDRDRLAAVGIELAPFDEVLAASDFLSIHVPLNSATKHLVGADALRKTKRGVVLVNLARGGVVDETALREALLDGRVAGAGLDVHEHEGPGHVSPLADLDNVLLTPHIGSTTTDTQAEIGRLILDVVERYDGVPPQHLATPDRYVVL